MIFLKSKRVILLFILFFGIAFSLSAQQDRFKWRFGLGMGNTFDGGTLYGEDSVTSGNLVEPQAAFLSYSAFLELSLGTDFGLKVFTNTQPGDFSINNSGLLLTYYFDNDYLLSDRSFVAPYLNVGVGIRSQTEQFNLPFGGGLKFRLGDRLNLNIDVTANTMPEEWDESGYGFGNALYAYSSLSIHYNFGRTRHAYKAPRPYVSPQQAVDPKEVSGGVIKEKDEADVIGAMGIPMDSIGPGIPNSIDSVVVRQPVDFGEVDTSDQQALLKRYGKILNVPRIGDSLQKSNRNFLDTTNSAIQEFPETGGPLFGLAVAGDTSQVPVGSRKDSVLEDLRFRVERLRLQNELRVLQKSGSDSVTAHLREQNQRLQLQLQTLEGYPALEQRISSLEDKKSAHTAGTANSTLERAVTSGSGATVGGVVVGGQNSRVKRLESTIDSLQNQINRLQIVLAGFQSQQLVPHATPQPVVGDSSFADSATSQLDSLNARESDSLQSKEETIVQSRDLVGDKNMNALISEQRLEELRENLQQTNQKLDSLLRQYQSPGVKTEQPQQVASKTFFETTGKVEIFFAISSAELSEEARQKLGDALNFASQNPRAEFLVKGFTDQTGSVTFNRKLADKRAGAVAEYLQLNGIKAERLKIVNMGQDQSLSGGSQSYGRRVEVVLN